MSTRRESDHRYFFGSWPEAPWKKEDESFVTRKGERELAGMGYFQAHAGHNMTCFLCGQVIEADTLAWARKDRWFHHVCLEKMIPLLRRRKRRKR